MHMRKLLALYGHVHVVQDSEIEACMRSRSVHMRGLNKAGRVVRHMR